MLPPHCQLFLFELFSLHKGGAKLLIFSHRVKPPASARLWSENCKMTAAWFHQQVQNISVPGLRRQLRFMQNQHHGELFSAELQAQIHQHHGELLSLRRHTHSAAAPAPWRALLRTELHPRTLQPHQHHGELRSSTGSFTLPQRHNHELRVQPSEIL